MAIVTPYDKLSATELATLPGDLHPTVKDACKQWADTYNCIGYADRMLLDGPPGTGKSYAAKVVARGARPYERSTLTYETCAAEVTCRYMPGPEGMVLHYGPGIRAWLTGARWVIEEIDQAGGDTIPVLHSLLDDKEMARFNLPCGKLIQPKEGYQAFATTNADPRSLPEALMDRFVIKRTVLFPDPRILMTLPRAIRSAAAYRLFSPQASDKSMADMTTRKWIFVGAKMEEHGISTQDALTLVLGPKLGKDAALACDVAQAKITATATSEE